MAQIVVRNLVKAFRIAERKSGMVGALKGLVTRNYRTIQALDSVSFSIDQGELVGYIGPNGAGKTMLMKILFGLYSRDAGSILVNGQKTEIHNPKDAINLGIGMIHQHFILVNRLTAAENIVAVQGPKKGIFPLSWMNSCR